MPSRFVGIAKIVALLAFFLPWMTVSCSSQRVMSATGWDLALGTIQVTNPVTGAIQSSDGSTNLWLILAILLIVAGALVAFFGGTKSAIATMGTSLLAAILIWAATFSYSKNALLDRAAAQENQFGRAIDASLAAMIRVEWHIGFWISLLALLAAAGLAWAGRSSQSG